MASYGVIDFDFDDEPLNAPPQIQIDDPDPQVNNNNNNILKDGIEEEILTLKHSSDYEHYSSAEPHTFKSLFTIETNPNSSELQKGGHYCMDLVIVFDASLSMKFDKKLKGVIASINYIVDILAQTDRLSLIMFSARSKILHRLTLMTENNKQLFRKSLSQALNMASAGTNIWDALKDAFSILNSRTFDERIPSVSLIMLLTDGRITAGKSDADILQKLSKLQHSPLFKSLTLLCYGYGPDHAPSLLRDIAFTTPNGLYYYVENATQVGRIFGESLYHFFNISARNVTLKVAASSGVRIFQVKAAYPNNFIQEGKEIEVSQGMFSKSDRRSVILICSCKECDSLEDQNVFTATLEYLNPFTMTTTKKEFAIQLSRRSGLENRANILLSVELNRLSVAKALEECLNYCEKEQYELAIDLLTKTLFHIGESVSSSDLFCRDLIEDINECCENMQVSNFRQNKYRIYALSIMYCKERSTGIEKTNTRSENYGYLCPDIVEVGVKAKNVSRGYLDLL